MKTTPGTGWWTKLRIGDDSGAASVEYAFVVSLVAVVIAFAVMAFGQSILGMFRVAVAVITSVV